MFNPSLCIRRQLPASNLYMPKAKPIAVTIDKAAVNHVDAPMLLIPAAFCCVGDEPPPVGVPDDEAGTVPLAPGATISVPLQRESLAHVRGQFLDLDLRTKAQEEE